MPRESTIKIQRSDTAAVTPSGLTAGELAVNLVDRKLFIGGTAGSNITFLDASAVVTSFNGITGAVTGVTAGGVNTFTALNSFSAGISAAGGVTFSNDITVKGVRIGLGQGGFTENLAVGTDALVSNVSGIYNTAVGFSALQSLTVGQDNSAFGAGALGSVQDGNTNTAIGRSALTSLTDGSENIAIGKSAMFDATHAIGNIAIGGSVLSANVSGSYNVAIGDLCLLSGECTGNVANGRSALQHITTGDNNVALGYEAGKRRGSASSTLTSATESIFIGNSARASASAMTREIVIGSNALGLGSNTAVIGATSQSSATIYGLLNAPNGLSAAGATFSGNISAPNIVNSFNGGTGAVTFSSYVVSVNGVTGAIVGVGLTSGKLSQFAATTSAELAGVISNETGSGALVFGTSPSISTLEISTTGTADKTAAINMASGVTATNSVASQISLFSYNADSLGVPPAPTSGFCSIRSDIISGYDLRIVGSYDSVLDIVGNTISIGDVSGANDGTKITIDASSVSVDITGTLNINGYNVFPLSSVVTTAAALTNVSTAQNAFPVGQQTLTVAQDTTYLIEGQYNINCGTTTHTTAIGFTVGGDVMSLTGLEFSVVMWTGSAGISTTQSTYRVSANASTQTVLNATSTGSEATILITGVWRNTSNETITPKIKFSAAPGGTNTMGAGSYIRFTPIANPTVGTWT